MPELLGGFGVEGVVVAGKFFAIGDIAEGNGGDGWLAVFRGSSIRLRRMVHEAAEVTTQDVVAARFIPIGEPADVLAGQFREGGKAFGGDGLIKTGFKAPKRSAARDRLSGKQTHAMDGTGGNPGFDQQHAASCAKRRLKLQVFQFQMKCPILEGSLSR